MKQALNNFVSTREITDQIENKAQKIDALSSLALQHAETGQYREAKKIFSAAEALANNMDEPGHNVKMLSLIASRQGQTRFINQANANLQQALLVAKKIPSMQRRMLSMGYVARARKEIGTQQESENLFRDMLLETQATQMESTESGCCPV